MAWVGNFRIPRDHFRRVTEIGVCAGEVFSGTGNHGDGCGAPIDFHGFPGSYGPRLPGPPKEFPGPQEAHDDLQSIPEDYYHGQ